MTQEISALGAGSMNTKRTWNDTSLDNDKTFPRILRPSNDPPLYTSTGSDVEETYTCQCYVMMDGKKWTGGRKR